MKDETKFLIEIVEQFGKDAQNVLDFVTNSDNIEKAVKAIDKPEDTTTQQTSVITGSNKDLPDGVYFISDNRTNYQLMTDDNTTPSFPVKYIGVKLGQRAIAVALKDLPGGNDGKLQLFSENHASPKTSDHYSYNNKTNKCMFNVLEDFNGQANTERLKGYGCTISLPEGEWIPSIGELSFLMMHASKVNRAIELAGGEPITGSYWSSTEYNKLNVWGGYFAEGRAYISDKCSSNAVRAVAAF